MPQETAATVLILDDEPPICAFISMVLEEMGLEARTATGRAEFISALDDVYDCIVLDLTMPDFDGVEAVRHLADIGLRTPLILMSGQSGLVLESAKRLAEARGLPVIDALQKPITVDRLERAVHQLAERAEKTAKTGDSKAPVRVSVEDLAMDIFQGRVIPYYQPKVCGRTGALLALEALARWDHREHGVLSPNVFLDLARDSKLIDVMTLAMLDAVLMDICEWRKAECRLPVAINIEAESLVNLKLPELLEDRLYKHGVDPSEIILEVTENGIMAQPVAALDNLLRLRMRGFRLSIDDFGTGHSTLTQLQNLPFNQLKIDKSFVDRIFDSNHAAAIVTATVELAKKLDLEIVAEGVETKDQARFLSECGCDQLQGYLYGRPMDAAGVLDFCRRAAESAA